MGVRSKDVRMFLCTVLTYRHELGMNYDFIRPDLIVGSCLQVISFCHIGAFFWSFFFLNNP